MQEGRSLLTISAGKTGWNSRQLSQGYPESAWTCAASSASLASVPVFGIAKRERPAVRLHSVGPERTAQERLWVAPRPSLIVSPPFGGPYARSSSCPWGSRGCGCNPSGVGFLGLRDGIAICAFRISFVSILQEGVRTFCPSTGQDPAGVGNAGPNPRHQTWALGWQTGPVFSDPRIQPLLHELFRPVRILCIFFMNT